MIDIENLKNKNNNQAHAQATADIPGNEKLTAEEFVECVVKPIIELQNADATSVKKIVRGSQTYIPVDGVITLPSEGATVSVTAQENTSSYIETGDSVKLHLRITSVEGGADTGNLVNIEFQKFANGSYTTLRAESCSSRPMTDTGYDEFEITDILSDGENQIRVVATDTETGATGRLVFSSIVKAALLLECRMDWHRPITNLTEGIVPSYAIYGTGVDKTLNIRIYDNTQNQYRDVPPISIGSATYNVSNPWVGTGIKDSTTDVVKVLTHGVHTIEAWVSCVANGVTHSSPHIKNQVMVVADESDTRHYLMIQQIKGVDASQNDGRYLEADNYVQTSELFQYAVYEPNATSMKVSFSVDDASGNVNCLRLEQMASNNTKYTVPATIQYEGATVGVTSYVYLTAKDANNNNILATKNNAKIIIAVNNKYNFEPVSGADLYINPSQRNNEESNPGQILNSAKSNNPVESIFEGFNFDANDGWVKDGTGARILRILSGQKLTVNYDPFEEFRTNTSANVTIMMDVNIKNVTNEIDPIIDITNSVISSGLFTGVRMMPLEGSVMTISKSTYGQQNFGWRENTRTHIAINICSAIYADPKGSNTIPLVRIFVNSNPYREFMFDLGEGEWGNNPYVMKFGQTGADIDIYSLYVYKKAVSAQGVMQNYKSSLPTTAEKLAFDDANDILGADGTISYEKAREKYSCIVHHGRPTSIQNPDDTTCWLHIDHIVNGVYDKNTSGDICKVTKSLPVKGQGTTAKKYADWNQQYEAKKSTGKITVNGAEVIDGWIDGNGVYKGAYYYLDTNDAKAEKLVGKINYASCMQSHKMGSILAYNDLYRAILGERGTLDTILAADPKTRCTCKEDVFFFFVQEDGETEPHYEGIMTFGSGKKDKKTWGYSDSYEDFAMFEGSDNDQPVTNFERPWNSDVTYNVAEEYFEYDGSGNIDFDLGKTVDNIPTGIAVDVMKAFINFGYLHCTDLKPWSINGGTATSLKSAGNINTDIHSQYWITVADSVAERGDLYSWSPKDNDWVKAGINGETRNVFTENPSVDFSADYEATNSALIDAIIANFRDNHAQYFNLDSCLFHSCFVQNLLAGSDNCAKNTYYVVDPVKHIINFHADDLDTIFKTDNVGWQTKPYYVDRVNHIDESGKERYSGTHNMFFNTFDRAYEKEKKAMMYAIFAKMASLGGSVTGFFDKYYFNIQRNIPTVAYLEQARIRYELRQIQVNISEITLESVPPITQQLGSQLESELQYMDRRLVYFMSYATYGVFNNIGGNSFGFRGYAKKDGTPARISLKIKPHQYLYPTSAFGGTVTPSDVRLSPSDSYELLIKDGVSSDTTCTLCGIDYYSELGNLGDISVNPEQPFSIGGKRLTKVEIVPTDGCPDFRPTQIEITAPLVKSVDIKCDNETGSLGQLNVSALTRLESIDTRNATFTRVILPQTQTLTSVQLGSKIDKLSVDGTPKLSVLTLQDAKYLDTLVIGAGIPNLNTLNLITFIYNKKQVEGAVDFNTLYFGSAHWGDKDEDTGITNKLMQWICDTQNVTILGTANIVDDVLADLKQTMVAKFGNVDNIENPFYVTYKVRSYTGFSIDGPTSIRRAGTYQYKLAFTPTASNNFIDIEWSISENNYATINPRTGILTATEPPLESIEKLIGIITAKITKSDETQDITTFRVYLCKRVPKVGDFAYADGTFDDELYPSKNIVGWVFRVIDNTNGTYKCYVQSAKDLYIVSSNGTTYNTLPWGIYSGNSYVPSTLISQMANDLNLTAAQVTDLIGLANIGTTGLLKSDKVSYGDTNIRDYNAYDELQSDGFAIPQSGGSTTKWDGKVDTASIIVHANQFIQWAMDKIYIGEQKLIDALGWDHSLPQNTQQLGDLLVLLKQANTSADYRELAYPAAYGCKLFEPAFEEMHEQYKKGNWYLPGEGELMRLYIYYRNSRGSSPQDSGTPTMAYNDLAEPKSNAYRPWYANFLKKASDKSMVCPISLPTQSNHWSSTEYSSNSAWFVYFSSGSISYTGNKNNSIVVRPVAAFDFEL